MTTQAARKNLEYFTIRIANQDQQIQHAKAGYDHWKKDSTFEQYWDLYLKERSEGPWGTNNKLLTWVLVRNGDPGGEIYAGCETYLRKGFIKREGSQSVENTYLYGIASVVTPKQHLRNGYATRLLSLLHHQLSSIPSPYSSTLPNCIPSDVPLSKAIGSILWSDVGSTFYSKCTSSPERKGWVVRDSQVTELVWKILPSNSEKLEDGWEWIYPNDLTSISTKLSQAVKEDLAKRDTTSRSLFVHDPSSEGTISFVPTKGTWQRPLIIDPEPVGIKYTPADGNETIVLFSLRTINIGDRLLITYIHNLLPDQLPALLNALDILGNKAGQKEGWIWDMSNSSDLIEAWEGLRNRKARYGRRQEIDGHLLGVAWYGDREDEGELLEGQMWTWC
ncbi:hypothetical protein I302_107838 [Kwoniella bestiolae CBS 10118]|uniref:N-acetyltransferase domain-containing protein n=1 Tax=Kwoniella bestiolae CBS 10118 TaxID=1296100 RepID=A0A1B9FXE9_9TREE|nr:hypothetical protein I302_06422 [Kwoniella bestiolae CBS 10118]OCF23440.1 hypothetical protein I302_06422 [Kwoniella bestiolae CBS 10118]